MSRLGKAFKKKDKSHSVNFYRQSQIETQKMLEDMFQDPQGDKVQKPRRSNFEIREQIFQKQVDEEDAPESKLDMLKTHRYFLANRLKEKASRAHSQRYPPSSAKAKPRLQSSDEEEEEEEEETISRKKKEKPILKDEDDSDEEDAQINQRMLEAATKMEKDFKEKKSVFGFMQALAPDFSETPFHKDSQRISSILDEIGVEESRSEILFRTIRDTIPRYGAERYRREAITVAQFTKSSYYVTNIRPLKESDPMKYREILVRVNEQEMKNRSAHDILKELSKTPKKRVSADVLKKVRFQIQDTLDNEENFWAVLINRLNGVPTKDEIEEDRRVRLKEVRAGGRTQYIYQKMESFNAPTLTELVPPISDTDFPAKAKPNQMVPNTASEQKTGQPDKKKTSSPSIAELFWGHPLKRNTQKTSHGQSTTRAQQLHKEEVDPSINLNEFAKSVVGTAHPFVQFAFEMLQDSGKIDRRFLNLVEQLHREIYPNKMVPNYAALAQESVLRSGLEAHENYLKKMTYTGFLVEQFAKLREEKSLRDYAKLRVAIRKVAQELLSVVQIARESGASHPLFQLPILIANANYRQERPNLEQYGVFVPPAVLWLLNQTNNGRVYNSFDENIISRQSAAQSLNNMFRDNTIVPLIFPDPDDFPPRLLAQMEFPWTEGEHDYYRLLRDEKRKKLELSRGRLSKERTQPQGDAKPNREELQSNNEELKKNTDLNNEKLNEKTDYNDLNEEELKSEKDLSEEELKSERDLNEEEVKGKTNLNEGTQTNEFPRIQTFQISDFSKNEHLQAFLEQKRRIFAKQHPHQDYETSDTKVEDQAEFTQYLLYKAFLGIGASNSGLPTDPAAISLRQMEFSDPNFVPAFQLKILQLHYLKECEALFLTKKLQETLEEEEGNAAAQRVLEMQEQRLRDQSRNLDQHQKFDFFGKKYTRSEWEEKVLQTPEMFGGRLPPEQRVALHRKANEQNQKNRTFPHFLSFDRAERPLIKSVDELHEVEAEIQVGEIYLQHQLETGQKTPHQVQEIRQEWLSTFPVVHGHFESDHVLEEKLQRRLDAHKRQRQKITQAIPLGHSLFVSFSELKKEPEEISEEP